ncbi:MAG: MBL fold metallo-hydrolase [Bacteriovoracaceae bacterium]|nr:MBL fold metallo-hydrolase [Bacteriovoracaceae bacterium]
MQPIYSCINSGTLKLDGGAMFGIIPKPLWNKKIAADESNRIDMTMRVQVIQVGKRVILIDTGIGDYHDERFRQNFALSDTSDPLLSPLKKAGIGPDAVTDIIISHLHFDHVGGLGSFENNQKELLFPKADIHVHQKHYEYSQKPNIRDAGSFQHKHFLPILTKYKELGQLKLLTEDSGTILSEGKYQLKYKTTSGHTPFQLHPYDEKFFFFGDIIPTAHHVGIPWVMGYDMNPGVTTVEKLKLLEWIEIQKLRVIFNHDRDHWGATVKKDEKGQFIFTDFKKSSQQAWEKLAL